MHDLERLLSTEARDALRDIEALSRGSCDVTEEEVTARMEAVPPQEIESVVVVMLERIEASRKRQKALEDSIACGEEWM